MNIVPECLNNKQILITGANGFLGKAFTKYLAPVASLTLWDSFVVPNPVNCNIQAVDICNITNFDQYPHFDYIINCAGIASPHWYNNLPLATLDVGTKGLTNILKLSLQSKAKVLYFSSSEVYGNPTVCPTPETYVGQIPTMTDRSIYDLTKALGESICHAYNRDGAQAVIVRPFNFCGDFSQNDGRILPSIFNKLLNHQPITIFGDGTQTRSFCYITDAIRGCLKALALGAPGSIYNIGNPDNEISMNDLVKEIERQFQHLKPIFQYTPRPSHYLTEPLRRCPDITKANNELNFYPVINNRLLLSLCFDHAEQTYKR